MNYLKTRLNKVEAAMQANDATGFCDCKIERACQVVLTETDDSGEKVITDMKTGERLQSESEINDEQETITCGKCRKTIERKIIIVELVDMLPTAANGESLATVL